MAKIKTVEDMFDRIGRELSRDRILVEIGHAEYDKDYATARLNGLKKALAHKDYKDRTTNVTKSSGS